MKSYILKVHSFVDLITNSSTEIYVNATEKTVEQLKALIDLLLYLGDSDKSVDDLFKITTVDTKEPMGEYGGNKYRLSVIPNNPDSANAKSAAAILENLRDIFEMSAEYNG